MHGARTVHARCMHAYARIRACPVQTFFQGKIPQAIFLYHARCMHGAYTPMHESVNAQSMHGAFSVYIMKLRGD